MTVTIDTLLSPSDMRDAGFVQEQILTRDFNGQRIGLPLWHLDGVPWYDNEPPTRWHTHWAQTRGVLSGTCIERCPCGAIGDGNGIWIMTDPPRRPLPSTRWRRFVNAIKRVRFIPV